jgi:Cu-Zn family superoxide dismutase
MRRTTTFPSNFLNPERKEIPMKTPRRTSLITSASVLAVLAVMSGCAGVTAQPPTAQAQVQARSGSQVSGTVSFTPRGDAVVVEARLSGLAPGPHGFHVHEAGDCSAADASSAKGHFNPTAQRHGHHGTAERHAGDLPNLVADASGMAIYRAEVSSLRLTEGATGIVGRSVVIHADADDYQSQPAGNSGKRIGCGVIALRG